MAKHKKETKAENEARVLEDNVRVLRSGLYGFIFKGKCILKSADLVVINGFSKHVKKTAEWIDQSQNTKLFKSLIIQDALSLQLKQPLFIPNQLPNTKVERIVSGGNHYEAVVRQKY